MKTLHDRTGSAIMGALLVVALWALFSAPFCLRTLPADFQCTTDSDCEAKARALNYCEVE